MKLIKYILLSTFVVALLACSSSKELSNNKTKTLNETIIIADIPFDTSNTDLIVKNLVISGSKHQMMGRHSDAILEFQQAVRYDSNATLFYAMGKSYIELSKFDLALENLTTALKLDNSFIPAWELLLQVHLMKYDLKAAIQTAETLIKLDNNKNRRLTLARLYEFEDIDKSIDIYEKVLEEGMDYAILHRLSYLYGQNNQNEEFISSLKKLYGIDNQDPDVIMEIFDYYTSNEEFSNLSNFINEVDKSLPQGELISFYIATIQYLNENAGENTGIFVNDFIEKIDKRFENEIYLNLLAGGLALKHSHLQKAEELFELSLRGADTLYFIPASIAYEYFKNKYYQKSVDIANKYEQVYPDSLFLLSIAADSYFRLDKIDEAIVKLEKILTKDNNNFDALVQIASLYDKKGMKEETIATYEKALRLKPYDALVNNNYAYCLVEGGVELDKALNMSNVAISTEPENAAYLDTYGWILFKLGRYEEAKKFLLKAIKIEEAGELLEHLGYICEALEQKEDAKSYWRRALKLEPEREHLIEKIKE